ncbi:ROK family transcriptional regulator [Microbacterium immunditiarum]|uniref:Putative NBD/HSP70 family sugar kinase n=1 Tax=Microbacterium immunditiarum TaxID=337480 RepID=A0A7Y9KI44_9MICO|nr:ROK family transcriptional regulator [Microbacterium immunditiarum]NYE18201.1 putative NBD/HSP70 family sugar kinase [Microbacterium immunditiarum]
MKLTDPVLSSSWVPDRGTLHAVALEVLRHGPLSRSDIARRLNLSSGSLTRLATELVEAGLLREIGERASTGAGRPSRLLDVVADSRTFIGLKLTADEVLGVVTDLRADVVDTARVGLPARDPSSVVEAIARLVEQLAGAHGTITAIGVGVGGLVGDGGVVVSSPFLEWQDVPLQARVEERTGTRTIVDNDLVALTECEHWFGAGRGLDRFAVITLGAGVGYGLVANGGIVLDGDYGIGLVGHWPLDPLGPLCPAGHRGCARSMLTQEAITTAVSTALGVELDYDGALDAAERGDPAARRVVDDAGRGLGRLLAAVANLTLPQAIILGGEGVRLATVARDATAVGMRADRDPRTREIPIALMPGDSTDWCRGAAVLAIQAFALGRELDTTEAQEHGQLTRR